MGCKKMEDENGIFDDLCIFFFAVKRHKMTMTSYELLDGPTKTRATIANWSVYDIGSTLTMKK
jgi:hypothetical protein